MDQDGGWLSGLSGRKSIDKSLLKNIIRHTDAHNKIQEQNEMWKQWGLKKQAREGDLSYKHDGNIRGYMRSDSGLSSAARKESCKWNRLLLEYEETRKDRWGHSGYKELYPDEFQHDGHDSEIATDESDGSEKVKIKNKSSGREKKSKKKKKDKTKESRKLTSDSNESDVETTFKHSKIDTKAKEVDDKKNHRRKKAVQSKESNFSRVESEKSRKSKYDYSDNDIETDRKSKKKNDREMDRQVMLNKESKTKRPENHSKSSRDYVNDERKERKRSHGDLKNGGRNKTRRTETSDSDDNVKKQSFRKRDRDDASRPSSRADEKNSSKKKKRVDISH